MQRRSKHKLSKSLPNFLNNGQSFSIIVTVKTSKHHCPTHIVFLSCLSSSCCQFLWIYHSLLSLRYSLTFIDVWRKHFQQSKWNPYTIYQQKYVHNKVLIKIWNIDENILQSELCWLLGYISLLRIAILVLDYQYINLVFPNVYRQTRNGYQMVANKWTSVYDKYNTNTMT